MGSLSGIPRSGMQMTAWGIELLDWNAKWVIGYRGTNELTLALERGEIDMTATGNMNLIQKLLDTGKFKILVQSGMLKDGTVVQCPEFGGAPLLSKLVEAKLTDPKAKKAFEYWTAIAQTDKWMALPPKTPKNIVAVYRTAWGKVSEDAEFLERTRKIRLRATGRARGGEAGRHTGEPAAGDHGDMTTILKKQGLDVQ